MLMTLRTNLGVITMLMFGLSGAACSRSDVDASKAPDAAQDLQAAGEAKTETCAVFAGGCFWCTEAVFEQLEGVTAVVSGYAGGREDTADYRKVSSGATDHAEVIKITYHPDQITYGQLLKVFFTVAHDPTQVDRQGPDVGRQYRSAIFYQDEQEKQAAAAYIQQLEESNLFSKPIATTLEPLDAFYPAEDYHQDYVKHNPGNGYVRYNALPKVDKVRAKFPEIVIGDQP